MAERLLVVALLRFVLIVSALVAPAGGRVALVAGREGHKNGDDT